MMYVYTYSTYVIKMYHYTPFYDICDFLDDCGYYFVTSKPPQTIGPWMTYTMREGFKEAAHPEEGILKEIVKRQNILDVHYALLGFENSVKMRYIPRSYGHDAYNQLLLHELDNPDIEPELFNQLAVAKNSTVDAEKEEYKLKQADLVNMFRRLIAVRYIVIDMIKKEQYREALAYIEETKHQLRS